MVILLDRKGLETALPDVAAGMVMAVIAADVGVHQPGHPGAQVAVADRPEDQVEMVGHQAVGQDAHRPSPAGFLDQPGEGGVVGRLVDDLRACVAAIEDTIAVICPLFFPGVRGPVDVRPVLHQE
jgi:hypothetical protein